MVDQEPNGVQGMQFLNRALEVQVPDDEHETIIRKCLANDLKLVFDMQTSFFSQQELTMADSRRNLEAIATIAERFFQSNELVTPDWPIPTKSFWKAYVDAVTLEVIRRSVLKPTSNLIDLSHEVIYVPNIGNFDEKKFFDERERHMTPSIRKAMIERDYEEWNKLDRPRIFLDLKNRSVEEWEAALEFENRAILDYIQVVLNSEVQDSLAPIIKKRDMGQELTEDEKTKLIAMQKFVPILWATNITEAFVGIKFVLGDNSTFRDFLQMLDRFEASLETNTT